MKREIPLFTLSGVPDAAITTHPFTTEDGLGLSMLRFQQAPADDVVLIVHGLTTSSDMFIMPEHENLVRYLHANGFSDVWTLDYRMSNRHPYNLWRHRYTMDDIALYDYPAALALMRHQLGPGRRIHVISHCLGALSFMMSLFGKAVDGVSSVIANSVALTPRVPLWSKIKGAAGPFLFDYVLGLPYVDPNWMYEPGLTRGKLAAKVVSAVHRECDVPACHMLSLMWGAGFPALYRHENLADITHRRGGDLYGPTSVHYHRHVLKMVRAGSRAVKYDPANPDHDRLPNNYFQYARDITTPVLLVTGDHNRVFADSNIVCHRRLEQIVPGRHSLHVFKGYGHQDVFMGERVAQDIFPTFLTWLERHRGSAPKEVVKQEEKVAV